MILPSDILIDEVLKQKTYERFLSHACPRSYISKIPRSSATATACERESTPSLL